MFGAIIGIVFGLYAVVAVINVIGVVIGAVFSGAAFMLGEVFSGEGLVIGIVIGLVLYFWLKKRNASNMG
uniref:Uncharacterized protein n=1 Tax=uncultured bacterium Contigcl_1556 TaxID=1393652 RepID=W0FLZ7_9BACT|nr:hypothetical protein [uncultured bacterium Contigcl_1556]